MGNVPKEKLVPNKVDINMDHPTYQIYFRAHEWRGAEFTFYVTVDVFEYDSKWPEPITIIDLKEMMVTAKLKCGLVACNQVILEANEYAYYMMMNIIYIIKNHNGPPTRPQSNPI
ncbi:hypothetical protein ACFE04_027387 [Oxalis oulophora]